MAPKRRPVPLNIKPIGEGQATSNTIDAASEWVAPLWVKMNCSYVKEELSVIVYMCVLFLQTVFKTSPM